MNDWCVVQRAKAISRHQVSIIKSNVVVEDVMMYIMATQARMH